MAHDANIVQSIKSSNGQSYEFHDASAIHTIEELENLGLSDVYMTQENPTGTGSFSLNRKPKTTIGAYSHAEGYDTTASGSNSHAEGDNTEASGDYSHAEGSHTDATNEGSHAEGRGSAAVGEGSHAEGTQTYAEGYSSHAEGDNTIASGHGSHAEGFHTTASSMGSHAEGGGTTASGAGSHAEGGDTTASGNGSHAEGQGTIATGECQHVQGKFNKESTTLAHIVGNGIADDDRKNAHTIDWDGNAWFQGDVYVGSTTAGDKDDGSVRLARVNELTDRNVDQTLTTDSNEYPLLAGQQLAATAVTTTDTTRFNKNVTLKPDTGTLTATWFKGQPIMPIGSGSFNETMTGTVTIDNFILTPGACFMVYFTDTNLPSAPKIKVNDTASKYLTVGGQVISSGAIIPYALYQIMYYEYASVPAGNIEQSGFEIIGGTPVLGTNLGGTGQKSHIDNDLLHLRYRASTLRDEEYTPTLNGTIAWQYE